MWVGYNPCSASEAGYRFWVVLALTALLTAGCSSKRDERAEAADSGSRAESGEANGDVMAAFDAWAKDGESESDQTSGLASAPGGAPAPGQSGLDQTIEQFNRKVSTCWKQPFGMPRLATVRILVQFNPDGTVRNVVPRPEASEAIRYRTEAPYLVMIAQTSRALRACQPYDGIRQNYPQLSQLEMVVDPRMFEN